MIIFIRNVFQAAFTSPHGYEEVDNEVKMGLELRPKPLGSVKNSNSKEPYTGTTNLFRLFHKVSKNKYFNS